MRKVLFLDIYGVLNSTKSTMLWDRKDYPLKHVIIEKDLVALEHNKYMSEESVAVLNELFNLNEDLDMVLSSTWRYAVGLEKTVKIMKQFGFEHADRVIGETERMPKKRFGGSDIRGSEIVKWMDDHKETHSNFVTLDDNCYNFDDEGFVKLESHSFFDLGNDVQQQLIDSDKVHIRTDSYDGLSMRDGFMAHAAINSSFDTSRFGPVCLF